MNEEYLQKIQEKKALADHYYDNYAEHYKTGDLSKASEFLWGVVNNLVYCLGLFDAQEIRSHSKVRQFLMELGGQRQDKEIIEGISSAERMHKNFYHNFMDKELFEDDKAKTERLIEKLALILSQRLQESSVSNPPSINQNNL